jgi:hypothetical protein
VAIHPPGTEDDVCPPVLVNIGDILSAWTDGLLKSTVHRVVVVPSSNEAEEGVGNRYSMAYFAHPVGTTVLEAVPSEWFWREGKGKNGVGEGVRGMTADEYLFARLKATYKGLYDNGDKVEGGST